MKILFFIYIFLVIGISGCNTKEQVNKSQVSTVEKLGSLDGRYAYYRYFVESGMAFGSGSVRMNILKSSETFDYSTEEYFTLQNAAPIIFGWKDLKTIKIIALTTEGEIGKDEPFKRETKNWKGFNIEIEYYRIFSTGRSPFTYTSCNVSGDTITFSDEKDTYSFIKGKVEITYNDSTLNIREIEILKDSTGRYGEKDRVLVSSNNWELKRTSLCDIEKFVSKGVFKEEKLKK